MGAGLVIDSESREFQDDPYAVYRRLREAGPVVRVSVDGEPRWGRELLFRRIEEYRCNQPGAAGAAPD